jgi:hypothetical protein
VKSRIAPWRAALLLASLALLLGIPATATASSAATSTGWIRLGNLSPATSPVDVYVYPSGNSTALITLPDVAYGTVSSYEIVGAGGYRVQMRPAGSPASSSPLLSASVTVQAGDAYTAVALAGTLKVLDDSLTTPKGKSLVRVIQASDQKQVTFHCSCAAGNPGNITTNAPSGSVSSYAPIPTGTWTMTATGSSSSAALPVTLTADTVHTEVVVDTKSGSIAIENLLDAAGSGQPPVGGIGTGFGGTTPRGPGSPLPWAAVIGTGALLALGGGLGLRRRRLHRLTTAL